MKKLKFAWILLLGLMATAAMAGSWSEWSSLPDGLDDNVQIAYINTGSKGSDGTTQYYWKYMNGYKHKVHIDVAVHYIDSHDIEKIDEGGSATIAAGEEYTGGGLWVYAKRIVGSRITKIKMLD